MYPQQNQQAVPYPYAQYVQQPQQVSAPPFIPQGLQVPTHIQHLLPQIVILLINTVVNNALGGKPLRVFAFNAFVQNNYANDTFANMVVTVVDMIQYGLYKGFYNQPEMGLNDSVEKTVNMMSVRLMLTYPGIQAVMSHEDLGMIQQFAGSMQQIAEEIKIMKMQGPQNMNFNPGFQNQGSSLQRIPVGAGNVGNSMNSMNNNNGGYFPQGSTSINGNIVNPVQNADVDDKYAYLKQKQTIPTVVPLTVQTPMIVEMPQANQQEWGPKTNNPYPPTVPLFDEGDLMDRSQHFPSALETLIVPPDSVQRRMANFDHNVEELVREKKKLRNVKDLGEESVAEAIKNYNLQKLSNKWIMDMSLEAILLKTRIEQMLMVKGNTDCEVFQRYGTVIKPILSSPDLIESIKKKAPLCNTYKKVANLLLDLVASYKGTDTSMTVIYELDRMLTKHMNSFLNNNLSLDINVDSFMSDIEALPAYVKDKFGTLYSNALLQEQENFIKNYLNFAQNGEMAGILDSQAFIDESSDAAVLEYVIVNTVTISVTLINILLNELNIDFSKNKYAMMLNSVSHPHLNTLLKCLFNKSNFNTEEDSNEVAKVYLMTADEKVLEAFEGKIGTEPVFLLKLVK